MDKYVLMHSLKTAPRGAVFIITKPTSLQQGDIRDLQEQVAQVVQ